jgi:ribosomal-protein-alanine N-acetyltransferase
VRALRARAHVPKPRDVRALTVSAVPLPLLTARLRLRALVADDLDELCRVWTDPRVTRWIGEHTREDVAQELGEQIESQSEHGFSLWAVEERASGRFLGDCGLQLLEMRGPEIEVGYELLPEVWGRGLATEAVAATLGAAFDALRLERVIAVVKPGNHASVRVLEKSGLHRADTLFAYGDEMLLFQISRAERRRRR